MFYFFIFIIFVIFSKLNIINEFALASDYKPHEIIVKYKEGTIRGCGLSKKCGLNEQREVIHPESQIEKWTLPDSLEVTDALLQLQAHKNFDYVQPNYIIHSEPLSKRDSLAFNSIQSGASFQWFYDLFHALPVGKDKWVRLFEKPSFDRIRKEKNTHKEVINYGIKHIHAHRAWDISRGSSEFIVANIDSGVNYMHYGLQKNLWVKTEAGDPAYGIGYDFVEEDNLPYDFNGHGTHTAGIIGALGVGVAQDVSIMNLRILDGEGTGTTSDSIRAIHYAIDHSAKVINASWSGASESRTTVNSHFNLALYEAVNDARKAGVLFVAAAGNQKNDNDNPFSSSYPASYDLDNVISVAAIDHKNKFASFSNYGDRTTHLAAPGVDILSTYLDQEYAYSSGTSMAAPHVTGAIALLWSKYPDWDYLKIKNLILNHVDVLPELEGKVMTSGVLNIHSTLLAAEE